MPLLIALKVSTVEEPIGDRGDRDAAFEGVFVVVDEAFCSHESSITPAPDPNPRLVDEPKLPHQFPAVEWFHLRSKCGEAEGKKRTGGFLAWSRRFDLPLPRIPRLDSG